MAQQLEYIIVIHPADEGGFWSEVLSVPGAGSQGESVEETVSNTKESIEAVLDVMKQRGEPVSPPNDIVVKINVAA
jgi:predicted RNase H-like HicB family nuclease